LNCSLKFLLYLFSIVNEEAGFNFFVAILD
jgi:hypothetical protein